MDAKEFSAISSQLRDAAILSARQRGSSLMEAEDIAQDVLLRLWQTRDSLDSIRSLVSFVRLIAARLALNNRRHKPEWDLDGLVIACSDESSSTLEEYENEVWLAKQLEGLPSSERTILYLRQVEKRSFGEIAELLGMTEHSVRTLLSKARRKLFEEFKRRNDI